ncbi:unnamed protein product [Pleuronectes platessa]|uniref:Uncharacterized protein n=1 Tax=Pleuronectes platessa TaxID=8262 RepID=A0A9N7TPE3_PLEPL|nr:unnamed protein product [Pleuronectes platessa]
MQGRRTTSSNPIPPSLSPPAPPPPQRPPLRSRRKSKSPSSRTSHATPKRALDLDKIGANSNSEDTRQNLRGSRDQRGSQGSQGSELDRKWEGVALELRHRGGRMRAAVYQTSDLPSMVKAKRQLEQSEGRGQMDRSKSKATFV